MSQNLDLVRSIYTDWERGNFSRTDWADPEIEFVVADGPDPGRWTGRAAMKDAVRDLLTAWEVFRLVAEECREVDGERVLLLSRASGRGKRSGLDAADLRVAGAHVFHIACGKVTRLVYFIDRDRALADLGLTPEAS